MKNSDSNGTGKGYIDGTLSEAEVREIVACVFECDPLDGKRVLCLMPDATRTVRISVKMSDIFSASAYFSAS